MKYLLQLSLIVASLLTVQLLNAQRNILAKKLETTGLERLVASTAHFKPYPEYHDRKGWQHVPGAMANAIITSASKNIGYKWPELPATLFLEFARIGNRSNYEDVSFERRNTLTELVLAECLEHKGRFLDDILNGVWAICEESYWGIPAHIMMQKKKSDAGLPDVEEPTVDLFAAETGSLLAWTWYFLRDQLDSLSPVASERIAYEIDRRILTPNLERTDFWWMGYHSKVNNWNPWIASNWLTCALIMEKDEIRKKETLQKIITVLDVFLNSYPDDGGCDEGPSYWGKAGGALFDCLQLLYTASEKSFDVFKEPLIKNIGAYLYHAHIDENYFINFADASAKVGIDPVLAYNFGERTGNEDLKKLGMYAAQKQHMEGRPLEDNLYHQAEALFSAAKFSASEKVTLTPGNFWLPQLQVFGAREKPGSAKGFFLAGKGGHNAESHNHNDVGSFIIYYDGKPVCIDVGVESYTAKTFSDRRYEIWTMQSAFHNLPTVNGYMQKDGIEYAAEDTRYKDSRGAVSFSLDLKSTYPKEAEIVYWKRMMTQKAASVRILDDYSLRSVKGKTYFTLMTPCVPAFSKGRITLAGNEFSVNIGYDPQKLIPEVEEINISDPRLRESWEPRIYRIRLQVTHPRQKDKIELVFTESKQRPAQ